MFRLLDSHQCARKRRREGGTTGTSKLDERAPEKIELKSDSSGGESEESTQVWSASGDSKILHDLRRIL